MIERLGEFLNENEVTAARFTGIGACQSVVLGYFDWEATDYVRIPIDEQVEVVSLVGDVALKDDESQIHAHAVVAKRDASAHGGHLLEAVVRPTLEIVLIDSPVAGGVGGDGLVNRRPPTGPSSPNGPAGRTCALVARSSHRTSA